MSPRRRRWRGLTCVPLVLLTLAVACSGDDVACEASDIPDNGADTIVVEGDPWSGYALFRDPELLAGTGYSLTYVEQLCQEMRAADLSDGRAEVILTSLDQYLLHQPEGDIVGVIDQSNGADALLLNNQMRGLGYLDSVDDLPQLVRDLADEGKKPVLAYTGNSPSEMLLDELSNTYEELRLDDFELVAVGQSSDAYRMLLDDEVHLAMLWEPDVSDAEAKGYPVALSSEDAPDSIVDVIVASNQATDEEAIRVLLQAYYGRMDEYLADEERTALEGLLVADVERSSASVLTREQATKILEGITVYGTAGADAFMNHEEYPLDRPQIEQSIDSLGALLALVHPGVDPERARVDGHYVQELAQ